MVTGGQIFSLLSWNGFRQTEEKLLCKSTEVKTPVRQSKQTKLADISNFAKFNDNIHRISKLPKFSTTKMSTFDRKSGWIKRFEDLLQTSLKIHNQMIEDNRTNYFHSLQRGDTLQKFKNKNSPARENLGEFLEVFRRKYLKPQSMTTMKHEIQVPTTHVPIYSGGQLNEINEFDQSI